LTETEVENTPKHTTINVFSGYHAAVLLKLTEIMKTALLVTFPTMQAVFILYMNKMKDIYEYLYRFVNLYYNVC